MTATANVPSVVVKRKIKASAQEIFDAWLDPQALAEWMRPCSTSTAKSTVTLDRRVGGAFEVIMHVPSGEVSHSGTYQVIDPPRQLVFTWNSIHAGHHDSLVTVDLVEDGEITEITLIHEQLPQPAQDGHRGGWTEILDALASNIEK